LLKEAITDLDHIAVMFDPATPSHTPGLEAVRAAGPPLGLRITPIPVRSASDYDGAFATMVAQGAGALLVLSTPLFTAGGAAARRPGAKAQGAIAVRP
jgi:hypothetical protein